VFSKILDTKFVSVYSDTAHTICRLYRVRAFAAEVEEIGVLISAAFMSKDGVE
jgi:hypothetical protein